MTKRGIKKGIEGRKWKEEIIEGENRGETKVKVSKGKRRLTHKRQRYRIQKKKCLKKIVSKKL